MSANNPTSVPVDRNHEDETQESAITHGTLFASPLPQVAGEVDRPSSPGQRLEPPHREIGVKQWFNNKQLSDIIVRYGDQGQRIFHGHKVILASSSLWFHAAFTNPQFIESEAREITLVGDHEESVHVLLATRYYPTDYYRILPGWPAWKIAQAMNSNKFALYHINNYAVADKYNAPKLRELAAKCMNVLLKATLDMLPSMPPTQVVQIIGLRGILDKVYETTGHWELNDPLRKAVLDVIMEHAAVKPIGVARPDVLAAEVIKAAQDIPDFGRDMFLRTMSAVPALADPPAYLDVVEEVTCPSCNGKWAKVAAHVRICGVVHMWKNGLPQGSG